MSIDFQTLMAYADGELDAAGIREVESVMAIDPEVRATVARLRSSTSQIRAAFFGPTHEPVPFRLIDVIQAPLSAVPMAAGPAAATFPLPADTEAAPKPGAGWRQVAPLAMAASVLFLIVGAGGGYLGARYQADQAEAQAQAQATRAADLLRAHLSQALSSADNGQNIDWTSPDGAIRGRIIPTYTFQDDGGRPCREYEQELRVGDRLERGFGVACRTSDQGWQVDYQLILGPQQSMAL